MPLFWLHFSDSRNYLMPAVGWALNLDSNHIMLVGHTSMPEPVVYRMSLIKEKTLTSYLSFSRLKMVQNYPVIYIFFFFLNCIKTDQFRSLFFWCFSCQYCCQWAVLRELLINLKNWWKKMETDSKDKSAFWGSFWVLI